VAELLVSVRSAAEAEAALVGGAALIDVKEPSRGSLGRGDDATLRAVIDTVAGRRPVSAALGELIETPLSPVAMNLCFGKWGLAGYRKLSSWQRDIVAAARQMRRVMPSCGPVAVAYADYRRANAPSPQAVCSFACAEHFPAFLLDTWGKAGTTLLNWLSPMRIGDLCARCREAGVRVALAGSLGFDQVRSLLRVEPDWFAVRGAVCRKGHRLGAIDTRRVRRLANLLSPSIIRQEAFAL